MTGFARIRKKDGMIHGAEPGKVILASADAYKAQFDVRRLPEQLSEGANCSRGVTLGGKVPESGSAPRVKTAFAGGFHKPRNGLFVRRSKIEWLIEFAGSGQFGAARGQARIVGNLAKAHVMEAGDSDSAFLRDIVERLADFRVRPALRDAEIARRPHDTRNAQTEVSIRKENPSAIFCDERVVVTHFSSNGLDFFPRAGREEDEGNFSLFQFF